MAPQPPRNGCEEDNAAAVQRAKGRHRFGKKGKTVSYPYTHFSAEPQKSLPEGRLYYLAFQHAAAGGPCGPHWPLVCSSCYTPRGDNNNVSNATYSTGKKNGTIETTANSIFCIFYMLINVVLL
jgi:hypothetical protein